MRERLDENATSGITSRLRLVFLTQLRGHRPISAVPDRLKLGADLGSLLPIPQLLRSAHEAGESGRPTRRAREGFLEYGARALSVVHAEQDLAHQLVRRLLDE